MALALPFPIRCRPSRSNSAAQDADSTTVRKLPLRAIAVNTGISTRDDLLAYTPDLLLEDQRGLTLPTILGPPIFDF